MQHVEYAAPTLEVLGTLQQLTLGSNGLATDTITNLSPIG